MEFDHVALATHSAAPVIASLIGQLGGRVVRAGQTVGFRAVHVQVGAGSEGLTVEVLEPDRGDGDHFLSRFLRRHGPGAHHLTFRCSDLALEVERLLAAGYHPQDLSFSHPAQHELFLSPAEACGTVVQVVQRLIDDHELDGTGSPNEASGRRRPRWWAAPPHPRSSRVFLRRIVMRAASLEGPQRLFRDLLAGTVVDARSTFVELAWPQGARLKIEEVPGGSPGIDRLECEHDGEEVAHTIGGVRFVLLPKGSLQPAGR